MRVWIGIITLIFLMSIEPSQADEMECLTEAVYFEARSEPFIGQLAVANVIMERVRSSEFPNTVCSVVHDATEWNGVPIRNRCAFSYWCDGKHERMTDKEAYKTARNVARMAIDGVLYEAVMGSTFYHASYVQPEWSTNFNFLTRIGKHLFYGE